MKVCALFAVVLLVTAPLLAEEPDLLDERGLRRGDYLADEGDYIGAMNVLFKILRHAGRDHLRSEAKERLAALGLSAQDIFILELPTLSPDQMELLARNAAAHVAETERFDTELMFAQKLVQTGVVVRMNVNREMCVDVAHAEVLRGLQMLLENAFSPRAERARRAQNQLENVGISGRKVEVARKAIKDGKVPDELVQELVPSICLPKLRQYYELLKEAREAEGEPQSNRRRIAREMGTLIVRMLDRDYSNSAQMKRQSDAIDFFRDQATAPLEKF